MKVDPIELFSTPLFHFKINPNNKEEIKTKLENLIVNRLNNEAYINPFGDYFSDENFKLKLDIILNA